ncbi:MAG: DUF2249 domain-containing protein [Campylobacterota bacterium]|nr:DUF2249 domain-containing protein [Campylobacterota bacterium]
MLNREKELVQIPFATLDFYKYEEDGITIYKFDATECQPPEPMVNTISALKMLKSKDERVVGTFFHEPTPLYNKISQAFSYNAQELENGDFEITFMIK